MHSFYLEQFFRVILASLFFRYDQIVMQEKPLYCQSMIRKLLFIHTLKTSLVFIAVLSVIQQVCFALMDLTSFLGRLGNFVHVHVLASHGQPRVIA